MYGNKIPKSQTDYKVPLVAYNTHTVPVTERKWKNKIRIISIDPGITNFCIRVEERGIKNYFHPRTLLYEKFRLKKDDHQLQEDFVCNVYGKLTCFLDQHIELYKTCHIVLIERQMPFNYKAVRISQHALSYFMLHLRNIVPNMAQIFEVDSKLKGRELGASNHLNKRGLKAWAVDEATRLLKIRNDRQGLDILSRERKKDDLADTVCQIEALFQYLGYPKTQESIQLTLNKPNTNNNEESNTNNKKKVITLQLKTK